MSKSKESPAMTLKEQRWLDLRAMEYCFCEEMDAANIAVRLDDLLYSMNCLFEDTEQLDLKEAASMMYIGFFLRDLFTRVSLDNGVAVPIHGQSYRFNSLDGKGGNE
jgi:hypothetical protein